MNKIIFIIIILALTLAVPILAQALEPSKHINYLDSEFIDDNFRKTISMDFKNAGMEDVLKIFAQQAGWNFVAETDVSKFTLNVYLDNVPVEEALERILSAKGLTYQLYPESNIFVVRPIVKTDRKLVTRVYRLQNASVPSAAINTTLEGVTVKSSAVVDSVRSLLSQSGSIVEDPRTNSLIVSDTADQIPLIEQAISRLDVRIPQILIEAEVLDTKKGAIEDIGTKWGGSTFDGLSISRTGSSIPSLWPFNLDNLIDDGKVSPSDLTYTPGAYSFIGAGSMLKLLRKDTETKTLARPRILTLNNHTAKIEIKTDEVIGKTITFDDNGQPESESLERSDTGVKLLVTPQANVETGEIIMAIQPEVINATAAALDDAWEPETRTSKSIMRVMSGNTVIIGGLLRTEEEKTITSVPLLGSIPVLGIPFRHKNLDKSERELLIFITPHIMDDFKKHDTAAINVKEKPIKPVLMREQEVPTGFDFNEENTYNESPELSKADLAK